MINAGVAAESFSPEECFVSGVRWAEAEDGTDILVPDMQTRHPVDTETWQRATVSVESATTRSAIELVRPPDVLLDAGHEFVSRNTDAGRDAAEAQLASAGAELGADYILHRYAEADTVHTTTNPHTGISAGFHVDNRDQLPLAEKLGSRRRLGVNIGPGDRWILACVPDVVTMADELSDGTSPDPHINTNELLVQYVKRDLGRIACIWLPVPAGMAHLTPTDLFPHDASTFGSAQSSDIFFFLGSWAPGRFPAI